MEKLWSYWNYQTTTTAKTYQITQSAPLKTCWLPGIHQKWDLLENSGLWWFIFVRKPTIPSFYVSLSWVWWSCFGVQIVLELELSYQILSYLPCTEIMEGRQLSNLPDFWLYTTFFRFVIIFREKKWHFSRWDLVKYSAFLTVTWPNISLFCNIQKSYFLCTLKWDYRWTNYH